MTYKTAYFWGPVSSFSGQMAAFLVQKGWHVHIATKGAFHIALSPLDLRSSAQASLERALDGLDKFKIFEERIRFLDVDEISRGTKYDAFIFCGLPPNFDEARVSRAPWAAQNFSQTIRRFKDTPVFIVSSLWGAVQSDGVVPEEIECHRRKPLTQYEAVAQQYENKLLQSIEKERTPWYLVRLPMISAGNADGRLSSFSGPLTLFQRISCGLAGSRSKTLTLSYNPDATMWFLPVDVAVQLFWRFIEDTQRPRICNLVSTQATLNQEWLQHFAKAMGLKKAVSASPDSFNLPGFLRKALTDNVLVKSRGLFEVTGRYQQLPVVLDEDYFFRLLNFCQIENWGKLEHKNGKVELDPFNDKKAREFFTKFMPMNVDLKSVKEVTSDDNGIGFTIDEGPDYDWVLRAANGSAVVENSADQKVQPKVRFHFTGQGLFKLIGRQVSLERALVLREARVEGHPLEVLKACGFFKKFLKDHPFEKNDDTLARTSKG
jgi:hypothetical protein